MLAAFPPGPAFIAACVGGGPVLVGGTLPSAPLSFRWESGSLVKALFLLRTRSIGEPAAPDWPSTDDVLKMGDLGAKSDADPCESLVRFFLRKPRDGIELETEVLRRFTAG